MFLHLIPLHELPTTFQTAEMLFEHIFRYFRIPENIVSYQGYQFTSRVWAEFMEKLGISVTSGYHPQANGQVERANQEVGRFLRAYCSSSQENWARFLPWAEYAQNSLRH